MNAKKTFQLIWPLLVFFMVDFLFWLTSSEIEPFLFTLTILFFLVFGWVQIALHELGHLLFGLATGYRFLSYRIFTWVVLKEQGKLHIKRQKVNEALAQCLMVPDERWNDEHYPYQLYLGGGIVFNILFSFGALFLLHTDLFLPIHVIQFSAIGFYMALSNAIPKRMNDGSILKKCRQNNGYRKLMYHQLYTVYYLTEGRRLSELPEESFALVPSVALEDTFSLYVMRLDYYRNLELSNFEKAADVIERQWQRKEKIELVDRIMIAAERLFCLSIQQNPEEAMRLYYHQEIQHVLKIEQVTFKRIFAAYYLFIEQDAAKAVIWCKAGLHLLESDTYDNSAELERQLLMQLKNQAETSLSEAR